MSELPTGTVTFLFSDIEGSTRLLQRLGEHWRDVLATHNRLLREAFEAGGGREVDRQGDAFFAAFPTARNALVAAATAQRSLAEHAWPDDAEVRVRMGVHTGEPSLGDEGYLGLDVVRAARICALARGGQVLVSETTRALARGELDGLSLRDLGEHRLKDIDEPEKLFQLVGPGLAEEVAPLPAAPPSGPPHVGDLEVAGRELELANNALAALRDLDFGPLQSLGPKIERRVEEALRAAQTAEERGRIERDLVEGVGGLQRLPVSVGWLAIGGIVVAVLLVGGVIWLLTALL